MVKCDVKVDFPVNMKISKYLQVIGHSGVTIITKCVCGRNRIIRRLDVRRILEKDGDDGYSSCGCKKGEAVRGKLSLSVSEINSKLPFHIECIEKIDSQYAFFVHKSTGEKFKCNIFNAIKGSNPIDGKIKRKIASEKQKHTEEYLRSFLDENTEMDYATFISMRKPMKFIDKDYGEWWRTPSTLVRGCSHPKRMVDKMINTCLAKYGVKYASQVKEISLKSAKSVNSSYIKRHWKTNEELICQGSYEVKVVNWLNDNKINFLWQPTVFTMPNDKTYRPDLYLIEEDLWVEIKGYWRRSKYKYDWFHSVYPNSEVWMKKELKEKGIM